jgi:hypothetical protein
MGISHRGYVITKRDGKYVATDHHFEMVSGYLPRVLKAIDALWYATSQVKTSKTSIDLLVLPRWLREWMANPTTRIDLDAKCAAGAC